MIRASVVLSVLGFSLFGFGLPTVHAQARQTPEWVHDAVIYQVFVRAFSQAGTLEAVTARVPELAELGINTLYLMPIHPIGRVGRIGSLGSPYSIRDFGSIDPALGNEQSLHALVQSAHAHGMRVIMDLVINHTALDHPFIREKPQWYRWNDDLTVQHPDPQWKDVAQLNYDDPDLRAYMIDMAAYWVREFDIDGFRADVSYKVPVDFWLRFRDEMRAIKPDLMLLSESDTHGMFLAFDIVYNWTTGGKVQEVASRSELPTVLPLGTQWPRYLNYLENHDQPRLASLTRGRTTKPYVAFLLTMPGVPLIQNGQEIGATERLSLFDRSHIRWDDADVDLRAYYKKLIAIRHARPELRYGSLHVLNVEERGFVLAYTRELADVKTLVVISFSQNEQALLLSKEILDPASDYIDIVTGQPLPVHVDNNKAVMTVMPFQSLIVPL